MDHIIFVGTEKAIMEITFFMGAARSDKVHYKKCIYTRPHAADGETLVSGALWAEKLRKVGA